MPDSYFSETQVRVAAYPHYHGLARVCKRFLHLARPLLYDFLALNNVRVDDWDDRSMDEYPNTHQLARTLCEAPHLRLLVRTINAAACAATVVQHVHDYVPEDVFRRVLAPILSAHQDLYSLVMHGLEHPCRFAHAVVVMLLSTNAKRVSLDWDERRTCYHSSRLGFDCMMTLLRGAFSAALMIKSSKETDSAPLLSFKHLSIDGIAFDRFTRRTKYASPDVLKDAMLLPGLRSIGARWISSGSESLDAHQTIEPESSSVTTIKLSNMWLQPAWLQTIIRSCCHLSEFSSTVGYPGFSSAEEPVVNPREIRAALVHQKDSLQALSITHVRHSSGAWYMQPSFGSLTDFLNLTRLELDEDVLVGWQGDMQTRSVIDMLPPNMKKMHLHTCGAAGRFAGLLRHLSPLQNRAVDELSISCAVDIPALVAAGGQNTEFHKLLSTFELTRDRDQGIFIETSHIGYHRRMSLKCQRLQHAGARTLTSAANMIEGNGLEILIRSQIKETWDWELVFGEALLREFDRSVEMRGSQLAIQQEIDFGDALSRLFNDAVGDEDE